MKTKNEGEIKELTASQYSAIALQGNGDNESLCCGSSCCSAEVYNNMSDDYSKDDDKTECCDHETCCH